MNKAFFYSKAYLLCPCILLLFYLALPYRYQNCDAIRYAEAIESKQIRADIIWHPSHILYGPLGYVIYNGLDKIGITYSPLKIYSIIGIISSALIVLIMGLLMVHLGASEILVAPFLLFWMSIYVVWICSTSSDHARNLIAILFILSAFYSIVLSKEIGLKGWPYLTGLLIGFAAISHILSIFAALPLFYFAHRIANDKIKVLTKVFGTSFIFVSVCFFSIAAKLQGVKDPKAFLEWFADPGGSQWLQLNPIKGTADLAITTIRSLFGIITYSQLKTAILAGGTQNTLILFLAILAVGIIGSYSLIILKTLVRSPQKFSPLAKAMMIWFCFQALFAVFFDSGNIRMVLYLGVPFMIILIDSLRMQSSPHAAYLALVAFIIVMGINISTVFLKESNPKTQKAYQVLNSMNTISRDSGDLFIVATCTDALFSRYFGNKEAIHLDPKSLSVHDLYSIVHRTLSSGGTAFISNDLVPHLRKRMHEAKDPLPESLIFSQHSLSVSDNAFQIVSIRDPILHTE